MTNSETLLEINRKERENIEKLCIAEVHESFSKCVAFIDDLELWVSSCGFFADYPLVKEAHAQCLLSIVLCAQGFYSSSIFALRQFLEHMLFSVMLSTNDYKYRLWQTGQYDMSWTQLMDENDGVFGKRFIQLYSNDLDYSRSIELLTIAKNVYRECSEFVHGNYEKLSSFSATIDFDENALNRYLEYFSNIQFLICMALFIRFRRILDEKENLNKLEAILAEQLGTLPEVQMLLCEDEGKYHE